MLIMQILKKNILFQIRQKAIRAALLPVIFCLLPAVICSACEDAVLGAGAKDRAATTAYGIFASRDQKGPKIVKHDGEPGFPPNAGYGTGPAATSRVVLIVLDKLTLQDLISSAGPELTSILNQSAVALMNVNTATAPGTESGYLTIGAGTRLAGNWAVRQAYNRDEELPRGTVESLYRRHTENSGVPAGEVLHLYNSVLQQLNEGRPYPAHVGALGETLQAGNLSVAVLGNADTDTPNRQIVALVMNKDGVVQYGDVGPTLFREREDFPFGRGSDPEAYLKAFKSLWQEASLLAVEWGDTSRLDGYLEHLPVARRGELLQFSMQEFDRFLKGIKPYLNENTGLLIVTPSPPKAAFAGGQRLMPIVYYHPGTTDGGFLLSPSTRRPGIVTNLDVAPSVLHLLGLKAPAFFFGAPWQAVPEKNHLQELLVQAKRTAYVYNQRPAVIKGYILAQIVLLSGGLAGLLFRFRPARILRPGLYALLFFPPAFLLGPALPFYPSESLYINVFALLGLTVLLTLAARLLFRKPLPLFAFTGLLVFSILAADLLGGAYLNSRSFLGYDPIGGARFYGLGNEYMGIMIGSLILGLGSLYSLAFPKDSFYLFSYRISNRDGLIFITRLFAVLSFFVLFLLASPLYGANFGGSITAGVALSVTLGGMLALLRSKGFGLLSFPFVSRVKLLLPENRFFPRCKGEDGSGDGDKRVAGNTPPPFLLPQKFLLLTAFILFTAALLYFLNLPRSDAAVSHVGRTWELVRSQGFTELVNVARRKMEINLKLLRYSLWSRILFVFIFLITLLYRYPLGLTQQIFREEPGFKLALGGIIAGSFTAFLVNDSGVVAAATTMLYGALPLLLLCFQKVFP